MTIIRSILFVFLFQKQLGGMHINLCVTMGKMMTLVWNHSESYSSPIWIFLHIYDDTSVPFSGKVFVKDTKFAGNSG